MSQSLAKNLVHLIYSTKHRESRLDDAIQPALWAYKAGILQQWESPALVIGGVADHVHILFLLSKNYALKKIVEEVKKGSSKWLKTQGAAYRGFHWQSGYGAFSVSQSNVTEVRRYIETQKEHHRRMSSKKSSGRFSIATESSLTNDTCGIEREAEVPLRNVGTFARRTGTCQPRATPWFGIGD